MFNTNLALKRAFRASHNTFTMMAACQKRTFVDKVDHKLKNINEAVLNNMIDEDNQEFKNPSPLEFDRSGRYHVVDGLP